jgi:preprotein translocase subunit YajC
MDLKFLSNLSGIVPLVLVMLVFYFLVIRPQDKKRKEHMLFVTSVKAGEKILTNTGMYGKVVKVIDDFTVEVEVSKGVAIKMLKSSVSDIISRKNNEGK